jgi:hypothetical protein
LGKTEIPEALFREFIESIKPRFRIEDYDLLKNVRKIYIFFETGYLTYEKKKEL